MKIMLFIHDLKLSLNVQLDSIQVKLFHKHNYHTHTGIPPKDMNSQFKS